MRRVVVVDQRRFVRFYMVLLALSGYLLYFLVFHLLVFVSAALLHSILFGSVFCVVFNSYPMAMPFSPISPMLAFGSFHFDFQ